MAENKTKSNFKKFLKELTMWGLLGIIIGSLAGLVIGLGGVIISTIVILYKTFFWGGVLLTAAAVAALSLAGYIFLAKKS